MSDNYPERDEDSPQEAEAFAEYAAELTGDLASLARKHGLKTLASLLEIARLEAEAAMSHVRPKPN